MEVLKGLIEMKNKKLATFFVLLAAALWGCMGIFVRYYNSLGLGSMDIVMIRIVTASVMLPIAAAIIKPSAFRIRLRDLWIFLGSGMVSIAMFNFCYFQAIKMTSLSVAAVLLYTAPIMVVFMSAIFFRERLTWIKLLACALAFGGCIMVSDLKGDAVPLAAIGIGILSAFGYAMYSIFSRMAMNRGYHSFTIIMYTFWISLFGVVPFSDVGHTLKVVFGSGAAGWLIALLMGLITAALPYIFYTLGLSALEAGKASVMASLEPVVATLAGAVVFGEIPSLMGFLGIIAVLAGVVLLNVRFKKM